MSDTATEAEILRLTAARGPGGSICPTEVARALVPGDAWHGKLSAVRRAAIRLAQAGRIEILRKGKPVDPHGEIRGVIRLRVHPTEASPGDSP
ncbi:conserved protein of unknown function [Rhodovastum atsumiense]|uniref:DUF3253 domain-containing protein n=1 Tax=Rhodovastum atsumiense TaxID=504468 RepID=A0A5M6IL61_9PROT|nr:DUF3253 domain-containing protein [Rhodovastum atsumiense]KAA5608996.1 DUF3253 domain-containing protein [Rhodovastum atsumiense]CAH2599089.1 conserved protein of unknown function [Rhodovastum atsumiense]